MHRTSMVGGKCGRGGLGNFGTRWWFVACQYKPLIRLGHETCEVFLRSGEKLMGLLICQFMGEQTDNTLEAELGKC